MWSQHALTGWDSRVIKKPQPLLSTLSCLLKFLHRVTVFRWFLEKSVVHDQNEAGRCWVGETDEKHSLQDFIRIIFLSSLLPSLVLLHLFFLPLLFSSFSLSLSSSLSLSPSNNENTGPVKGDVGFCGPWALQHQYQRVSRRGADWALKLCLFQQMSPFPKKVQEILFALWLFQNQEQQHF